jgi:hypothetical protein
LSFLCERGIEANLHKNKLIWSKWRRSKNSVIPPFDKKSVFVFPKLLNFGRKTNSLFLWVKLPLLLFQNLVLKRKPEIIECIQKLNQVLFGLGYDLDH